MMTMVERIQARPTFLHVEVELTNKCGRGCIYCDRCDRHLREDQRFEMSLSQLEEVLDTLVAFPAKVGFIGGEPQLHSQFVEVCKLIRRKMPRGKVGILTSIPLEKSKYRAEIEQTFHYVPVNEHNPLQQQTAFHQPFSLAVMDMVPNPELRRELIKNCWIADNWCPSISPLGVFNCEVAFGIASLLGAKGWPIEPFWWRRQVVSDQLWLCEYCGGCIPMEKQVLGDGTEKMSVSFLKLLLDNDLPTGPYTLVTEPFSIEYMANWAKVWRPSQYRGETVEEAEAMGNHLGNRIDWGKWLWA